jgi:hypothetical protein
LVKLDGVLTFTALISELEQIVSQSRKYKGVVVQSGIVGPDRSLVYHQHCVTVRYCENLLLEVGNPARGQHTSQVLVTAFPSNR